MQKEKIMIFPFSHEFSPILRNKELISNYEILGLVSPKGWGLTGKDASFADGGEQLNIKIHSEFDDLLDECETIMFTDCDRTINFNDLIYPKIKKAIVSKKNIICTLPLEDDMHNQIKNDCKNNDTYFKYYNLNQSSENIMINGNTESEELLSINTPVIFVLGIGEQTQKFEIQLSLRKNLLSKGYKVSQVGSRNYCELLGFHSIPSFMYSSYIPEHKKVVLFNNYIKNLEKIEKPDVFIIGVPGGISAFDRKFTNRFGLMAYEISQAITPDVTVFSTLYEYIETEFFEELFKLVKYRFGFNIDCYNLSNRRYDREKSMQSKKMKYSIIDYKFIDKKKSELNKSLKVPVYNILNHKDSENLVNYLITVLAGYNEVSLV